MQVTLDDLYKDKAIVGDVLDDDYEPVPMSSGVVRAKRAMGFLDEEIAEKWDRYYVKAAKRFMSAVYGFCCRINKCRCRSGFLSRGFWIWSVLRIGNDRSAK